jgi:O-antigen ligase
MFLLLIKKSYHILFFLGLFFFPFNEYQGIDALGEFKSEAGALFFMAGFVLLIVESMFIGKISIPYKSIFFKILIIFLLWCFITTLLNGSSVLTNYFKHTGGVDRFLRQYFALLLSSIIFFIYYWNVLIRMELKDIFFKIRKIFLFSLIVATVYGFLETLVSYFGFGFFFPILELFDYFPFLEVSLHVKGRISSISYEPPFFAIYLITISGWMFSYILTSKKISRFLPTIAVLTLTFFSGSRTGLMVVFFQLLIFITILFKEKKFRRDIVNSLSIFLLVFSVLLVFNGEKITKAVYNKIESLDFKSNLKKNISNKSRFGMQYASLQVFKENPLIGVGFGQQSYHNRLHYPIWATRNNYEFDVWYKNKNEKSFPPGYNIYTRLLAETGIFGFVIYLSLVVSTILMAKKIIRNSTNEKKLLGIVLLISFSGLYINGLQVDTFRIYGIWICLAILIKLTQENKIANE